MNDNTYLTQFTVHSVIKKHALTEVSKFTFPDTATGKQDDDGGETAYRKVVSEVEVNEDDKKRKAETAVVDESPVSKRHKTTSRKSVVSGKPGGIPI